MGEKEEKEQAKQFGVIGDLISEIKKQGEKVPMSAKEEAAATKKLLDTQVEMLKLFESGIPSNLSSASEKAIMSAAQQAGIDVTEKQEDKAAETERFLIQLAFKAKMDAVARAKKKAKEDGDRAAQVGLGVKGLWVEGTNKISEKILDLKEKIVGAAKFDNLSNAFSQDMSLLTMEFQGLMQLPGMKTIVAGIKYLASWAAKILQKIFQPLFAMFSAWFAGTKLGKGIKKVAGKVTGGIKTGFRRIIGKTKADDVSDDLDKRFGKGYQTKGEPAPKIKAAGEKFDARGKDDTEKDSVMSKIGEKFKVIGKKMHERVHKIALAAKGLFKDKDTGELNKAGKVLQKGWGLFRKGLGKVTGAFKKLGKNLLKSAKRMIPIILGFIVNMGIWLVNMAILTESWKMETGRVAGVEKEREAALEARDIRDKKLQADFDTKHAERGRELEDAAKLDADRKAGKDAKVGVDQMINTSIQTDAREIVMTSESTSPKDTKTLQAVQALDG
jgi:hypothetical protein